MENMMRKVRQYLSEQRKMSRWHKLVTGLAGVVVFCTTYALILPAITLTTPLECGLEEHTHTEACYRVDTVADRRELTCELEEAEAHIHDDSCYTEQIRYSCDASECEGHTHDDGCYAHSRELTCDQEEESVEKTVEKQVPHEVEKQVEKEVEKQVEHETTDENGESVIEYETVTEIEYETVTEIEYETVIETVTETVPHEHTDSCYSTVEELICTQEETQGHTHDDSCGAEIERVLTCGKEETEGHTHTDGCWRVSEDEGETRTLICGKQEHTHDDNCYLALELEQTPVYGCGFDTEHLHDDSCYFEDGSLKCTLVEHIHTEECADLPVMLLAEGLEEFPEIDILGEGVGEVNLSYPNGLVVPKNEDGSYDVDPDEVYLLTLAIDTQALRSSAHYVYQLPAGIIIDPAHKQETELRMEDGTLVGKWWVDESGKVIVETNEDISKYSNIKLFSALNIGFSKDATNIEFDGGIKVNIKQDDKSVKIYKWELAEKDGGTNGTDSNSIEWIVQIWGNGTDPIVGSTIRDELVGGWPAAYAAQYTPEDMAKGIKVQCYWGNDDWQDHYWMIYPEWTQTGWSYVMPEKVTCEHCNVTVELKDEWAYQFTYTATIPEDAKGIVGNQNQLSLTPAGSDAFIKQAKGFSEHYFIKDGEDSIKKTSEMDPDTDIVTWTINATVYVAPGEAYPSIALGDQMTVRTPDGTWLTKDSEGEPIAELNVQDPNAVKIEARIDGKTYEVPFVDNSAGAELYEKIAQMLADQVPLAYTAYTGSNTTKNDTWAIDFWNLCRCEDEEHCQHWTNGKCANNVGGYCTCWGLEGAVELTITYQTCASELRDRLSGNYLFNKAAIYKRFKDGKQAVMESSDWQKLKGSFGKTLMEFPQAGNNYTAEFEITVNEAKKDLSVNERVEIEDQMSDSLVFMAQTLVVTAEDREGNVRTLTPDTDYKTTYDVATHKAVITLLKPGPFQYTLNYDAAVVLSGTTITYSNAAKITLNGVEYKSEVEPTESVITSVYGESYSITLYKDNINDERLPDAVFGLYAANGNLITKVTTDQNGYAELCTDTANGVFLYMHTPYYVQEIVAPAGYQLSDTKYWFMFCDGQEGETCELCDEFQAQHNGGNEEFDRVTGTSGERHIVNIGVPMLPATGGNGRIHLYTMGALLLTGAAYLMYKVQRRVRREEDAM